ncbi:hypothetical protein SUDANB146_00902 [Streptomyces sp. enrichment culture]
MPHGVRAQLGGDQRQRLVDLTVVGVAPGAQAVRDEQPRQPGSPWGRGERHRALAGPRGAGGGESGVCMRPTWRPGRACHQERRLYGRALCTAARCARPPGRGGGVARERCRTAGSAPAAPLPKLREDRLLTGGDVTVHGGHALRVYSQGLYARGRTCARSAPPKGCRRNWYGPHRPWPRCANGAHAGAVAGPPPGSYVRRCGGSAGGPGACPRTERGRRPDARGGTRGGSAAFVLQPSRSAQRVVTFSWAASASAPSTLKVRRWPWTSWKASFRAL